MSEIVQDEYRQYPTLEYIEYYCEGGYHPVHLDDIFNDRYRIVNKLGFASTSTVWLVEDLCSKRFASLKILTAEASEKSSEMHVAQHLEAKRERLNSHPGREHVAQILDTFTVHGPNGVHHCIVMELLGVTLGSPWLDHIYDNFEDDFPQDVGKKLAAQVALGVAYLHKCGVIHGDLHLGNMLFYSSELQTASRHEIRKIYGRAKPWRILYEDGTIARPSIRLPRHVVGSASEDNMRLLKLCLLAEKTHIKICDFGSATIYEPQARIAKPVRFHMPLILRAPEVIFNDLPAPSFSMDIPATIYGRRVLWWSK